MKKLLTLGTGAVVATAAFSLFALTANAQQPPAAPPAATVTKPATPPAAITTKPATTTPGAATATKPATTTPAKPKAVAAVCKGLDETGCKANPECSYVVPKDANKVTGKVQAPYCRKVAGVAKPKTVGTGAPATGAAPVVKSTAPVKPATTPPAVKPATTGAAPAGATTAPKPQ